MHPSTPPRQPAPADSASQPHPLTIFLTAGERRRVLRALRAIHPDRARALLIALGDAPSSRACRRSAP